MKKKIIIENQPRFKKYLFWIILSIIVIIGGVLGIFFSFNSAHSKDKTNNILGYGDIFSKPQLTRYKLDTYSDDAQPNVDVPKLSSKFQYGKQPINGVNLGGWLVIEPFITPSLFSNFTFQDNVKDEWTMCQKLGKEQCQTVLNNHYDTFVTEEDIKKIASLGLNHVRIPIGYWALDIQDDEPFVYSSFYYLLRGINWARKYGLRVMIEFHGAPGSQNGWNHSGKLGSIKFLNQTDADNEKNIERFKSIYMDCIKFFSKDEWKNVVTLFGVLNEPAIYKTNFDYSLQFFQQIYNTTKKEIQKNLPILIFHEGFLGIDKWAGKMPNSTYKNVALDTHNYLIFDKDLVKLPKEIQSNIPCESWKPSFEKSMNDFGWTMSGEFSAATNDCGKWLNGVGLGARYDGTYELEPSGPACSTCTCEGIDNYKNFTKEYKNFLSSFVQKQMSAFESGIGWFFWNFKTENHVNPHWDYFAGVDNGWIPIDSRKRDRNC